jgi:hypothetical protein
MLNAEWGQWCWLSRGSRRCLGAEDPAPANARMPPWTADEVVHETKRDVLRWLQTHCNEDFIKSQRLSVRPGHAC